MAEGQVLVEPELGLQIFMISGWHMHFPVLLDLHFLLFFLTWFLHGCLETLYCLECLFAYDGGISIDDKDWPGVILYVKPIPPQRVVNDFVD